MKKVQLKYTGEYSGVSVPLLKIHDQPRGVAFEADESLAKAMVKSDPKRWEIVTGKTTAVSQEDDE